MCQRGTGSLARPDGTPSRKGYKMGFFTVKDKGFNDRVHIHDDGRITDRNFDSTGLHLYGNELRDSRCETLGHLYGNELRDNAYNTVGYVKDGTLYDRNGNITGYVR